MPHNSYHKFVKLLLEIAQVSFTFGKTTLLENLEILLSFSAQFYT